MRVAQQCGRRLDEQQVGVLLLGEAHDVLAGVAGREGGRSRHDAVSKQLVATRVERPCRRSEAAGVLHERGHEQFAVAAGGERSGQPDERIERFRAELSDQDRALGSNRRGRRE